ncbi:MAG: AraC family transcriptional regulator [Clostridia bacterium]|nr:AraC family transcriptional regulator [Clostridia bacterium]
MATKKIDTLIEHKIFNINMPFPKQGVNFNWCYQNYTSLHEHDYYEFVIVTDGKVKHVLKGTASIASQGMLFLIKPGEFHQFLPYHNHHSKHINFCISAPAMQEISKVFWLKDMSDTVNNWVLPNDLFLPQKDFEAILNSINRLSQFPVHSQNSFAVIKSIIIELLLFLFQKSNTQKALTNNRVYPAWLNIFLDTLSDPKVFTRQLKDIYPLAPYSRAMLNTHFKNYVGTTLISYITRLKINYACTLLQYTDSSLLEIANLLEYDSLSHFSRTFKQNTGLSPIAYKKKFLNYGKTAQ